MCERRFDNSFRGSGNEISFAISCNFDVYELLRTFPKTNMILPNSSLDLDIKGYCSLSVSSVRLLASALVILSNFSAILSTTVTRMLEVPSSRTKDQSIREIGASTIPHRSHDHVPFCGVTFLEHVGQLS